MKVTIFGKQYAPAKPGTVADVEIDGEPYVLCPKFPIGSLVRVIKGFPNMPKAGAYGIVRENSGQQVGVEFFTTFKLGHNLYGKITRREAGYYYFSSSVTKDEDLGSLELVEEVSPEDN